MRQPIETAPRDGKEIWVEDDQSAYDVAHWSSATKEWVWKNGRPIRITPTHWSPIAEPQYQQDKQSGDPFQNDRLRRWFVASVIAAVLVLNGLYFRTELIAFATRQLDLRDVANLDIETAQWPAETRTADLQRSLDKERARTAALTREVTQFRIDLETAMALSAEAHDEGARRRQAAEELRQSLQQEQAGATALADELLGARREIETHAMQLQKVADEAAQQKQSADAVASELRDSLRRQQEKTTALTQEIGTTRDSMTAIIQRQRRELDEAEARGSALAAELSETRQKIETHAVQSQSVANEALQQKQTAEEATAKLRDILKQERRKTAALAHELDAERQAMKATGEQQRRALDDAQVRAATLWSELAGTQRDIQTLTIQSKIVDEVVQQKQAAEATIAELRTSLQREESKTAALTQEVDAVRKAATAAAEQQGRALDEAQARAAAFATELAGTRREIEIQKTQSRTAVDDDLQQKLAAENATAKAQDLRQAQKKVDALTLEVGAGRQAMTASAEQQRPALNEAQAQALANQLAKTGREAKNQSVQSSAADQASARQRQSGRRLLAGPRQSPQQERDKTEAMARDLSLVRRSVDQRELPQDSSIAQALQSAARQPAASDGQQKVESARLIARARTLLGQGNIGAAQTVLERAAESGNAYASFMLAETYDPVILSAWGTYGTRGAPAKARELYAKAHSGGIREAKERLEALRE